MIKVGYRHNEWLAVYTDECGDRQIIPFDTYEQAVSYLTAIRDSGTNVLGVMTTLYYNHYIEHIAEEV